MRRSREWCVARRRELLDAGFVLLEKHKDADSVGIGNGPQTTSDQIQEVILMGSRHGYRNLLRALGLLDTHVILCFWSDALTGWREVLRHGRSALPIASAARRRVCRPAGSIRSSTNPQPGFDDLQTVPPSPYWVCLYAMERYGSDLQQALGDPPGRVVEAGRSERWR
jgi:hypothetical protein